MPSADVVIVGDLIEAVESGHDAEPPVTTGRLTGRPIDIGAFGRNRPLDTSSSTTVQG